MVQLDYLYEILSVFNSNSHLGKNLSDIELKFQGHTKPFLVEPLDSHVLFPASVCP